MKRIFFIVVGFVAIVGYASASPMGGQLANYLYANSLYGIAHPLHQGGETLAIAPYAFSPSAKASRGTDLTMGILGNIFIPGLGSALIGDHNALWIFTGFALSVTAVFAGGLGAAAAGFNSVSAGTSPGYSLWDILILAGGVGVLGFEGWGIYSPIHYVNQKFPAS